jgi:periplasmic copper chaperone A
MNSTTLRRRTLLVTALIGGASLLAACGSSSSSSSGSAKAPTATGVWARTSAAMQTAGAAYMVLENKTDTEDALVKAAVAATVAGKVEIHETVAADSAMASDTTAMGGTATTARGSSATTAGDSMGAMKMQPVDKIVVPAKGKVELKPGGYHVMLLDLPKPLVKGEKFDLTLTFASGATSTVAVEVRDQA